MEKQNTKDNLNQEFIGKIIHTIDENLLDRGKTYASLTFANELLIEKGILSKKDQQNNVLRKILEEGHIKNAYLTQGKPRQWRILLSENGKKKYEEIKKRGGKDKVQSNKSNTLGSKHKQNTQSEKDQSFRIWNNELSPRQKKGFKRLIFIVVITLIIVVINILPDNSTEYKSQNLSNKATMEENFDNNLSDEEGINESKYKELNNAPISSNNSRIEMAVKKYTELNKNSEIIGIWSNEDIGLTIIKKRNNKYFINDMSINNFKITNDFELITMTKNNKRIFIIKDFLEGNNLMPGVKLVNEYTDYYQIESNGNLSLYDNLGLIEKYHKID